VSITMDRVTPRDILGSWRSAQRRVKVTMAQLKIIPSFSSLTGHNVRIKVVDIGANPIDGDPPYACMLRADEAEVVGFEPNPEALARLNANKGENETYLPFAVGDGEKHTLHMCRAQGMSSIFPPNPAVLNLFHGFPEWGQILSTTEVQSVRLDDIAESMDTVYIKIDIEGAELLALQHAQARLKDVLVIQAEVEFLPIYVGQPLFSEVESFLRSQGFIFHRFFPINSRVVRPMLLNNNPYQGFSQVLAADAVFVRDFTCLDHFSSDQLLKMAAIMHNCYGSFDLSLYFVTEQDRRAGCETAPKYLAGLKSLL